MESSKLEKRWHIVSTHKAQPDLSYRTIGAKVGVDHKTVQHWLQVYERTHNVNDEHRSGRKPVLPADALLKVNNSVTKQQGSQVFSANKLTKLLESEAGIKVSPSTVRRQLKGSGWRYGCAKKVLMLKPAHKQSRLLFCRKHLNIPTSFSPWMFTDSKLFLLHKTSGKAGVRIWYPKGGRPSVGVVKQSQGVHVYLGVTKYGATKLVFVTGGGSQRSVHINPKTGQPYSGVSAIEYQEHVLPVLIREGNRLFQPSRWASEWIFQQDNARAHTASSTKAVLEELLPNRFVQDWPPMSPDLSWIENIWSWAQGRLNKLYVDIQTIDELKAALVEVLGNIPSKMLRKHVRHMPSRLEKVVKQNGGPIG